MPFRPFFLPPSEITNQLMMSMGQRRAEVLRETARAEIEREAPDSDDLLRAALMALENEPEHSVEHDWEDQRSLSDIMYHLLGRLAGRARRQGAPSVMMTEATIIEGMSTSLGLYEPRDIPLLQELASEFSLWLSAEPNNSYPAGWGRIVRDPYDRHIFYLEPFESDGSATPTELHGQPRETGVTLTMGGGARAANATGSRFIEVDSDA